MIGAALLSAPVEHREPISVCLLFDAQSKWAGVRPTAQIRREERIALPHKKNSEYAGERHILISFFPRQSSICPSLSPIARPVLPLACSCFACWRACADVPLRAAVLACASFTLHVGRHSQAHTWRVRF
jgi:hypothetical protein